MTTTIRIMGIEHWEGAAHHLEARLDKLSRYVRGPYTVDAMLGSDGYAFHARVSVHLGRRRTLRATGEASELRTAVDLALRNLEDQVRRHRARQNEHRLAPTSTNRPTDAG